MNLFAIKTICVINDIKFEPVCQSHFQFILKPTFFTPGTTVTNGTLTHVLTAGNVYTRRSIKTWLSGGTDELNYREEWESEIEEI